LTVSSCLFKNFRYPSITGYIKNRFIGFNLRQIQDILDYSNIYKIEGAIIFLGFSKAFDSLEWNFMLSTQNFLQTLS
jgi:hypothetical protein